MTTPAQAILAARDGIYADDLLIAAVAHLDVFTVLAGEALGQQALAARLGLADRGADVLCTLLRASGLLHPGEPLQPTPAALDHLADGGPGDVRAYLASLAERPACLELLDVLRTDRPAQWASSGQGDGWLDRLDDPAFAATITAAMDARARVLGPPVAAALADLPFTSVLDVAGGSGAYAAALVAADPAVRATVVERAPVDRAARAVLRERGLAERVRVVEGDMLAGLPGGHDLHLLSHVLHDWDEASARAIVARCFEALAPGGWIADHDAHLDDDKCGPLAVARYSVLLFHSTAGRCWSGAEVGRFFTDAGFADVEHRPAGPDRTVVLARKPR